MSRSFTSYIPSRNILIGICFTAFIFICYCTFQSHLSSDHRALSEVENHIREIYDEMANTLRDDSLIGNFNEWTTDDALPSKKVQSLGEKPFDIGYFKGDSLVFWNRQEQAVFPPSNSPDTMWISFRGPPASLYLQRKLPRNRTLNAIYSLPNTLNALPSYRFTNSRLHYGEGGQEIDIQNAKISIEAEGVEVPFWISLGGLFALTGFILFFCIGLHRFALRLEVEYDALRASIFLVGAVFLFRFLLMWSGALDFFNHFPFFEQQLAGDGHVASYMAGNSMADIVLNMSLLFWLSTFLISHLKISSFDHLSPPFRFIVTGINYFGICLELMLLSYVLKHLIIHSGITFNFDHIFSMSFTSLTGLLSILLFVITQFFLSYLLAHVNHKLGLSSTNRLWTLLAACLISLPVFLYIDLDIHPFPFYAALIAYNVLLDLFWDRKQSKTSWLIIWLLVLSGLTTVLLYKYDRDNDQLQRRQTATELSSNFNNSSDANPMMTTGMNHDFSIYEQGDRQLFNNAIYEIKYPFDTVPAVGSYLNMEANNRSELLYRPADDRVIVVGNPSDQGLLKPISLFSYTFTMLSLLVFILVILNRYHSFLPERWILKDHQKHSLRRTIQIALIALCIFSFLVVSLVTVWYFNHTYDEDQRAELQNKANTITSRMQRISMEQNDTWKSEIFNLAKTYQTDINIYDSNGMFDFQASSNYAGSSALPVRLPYDVLRTLRVKSGVSQQLEYQEDEEQYIAYGTWEPDTGQKFYFSTPQKIQSRSPLSPVNDFISTLLNVYVFLFLIAGILAVIVADSITRPLKQLSDRLRQFRLGKKNKPIPWERKDELGALITDYNRMVRELDESAEVLAMTQRELAWREMAKQVAHEIKNPLTPMRLSIQHLQMANKQNEENSSIKRISNTLLEQIDNLSQIASEFSNFANMPKPENEKIVLNDVVASVHDLFRKRDDMDINCYVPIDELFVFADRNQLTRVLNNILKNAIQSIPREQRGNIDMKLFKKEEMAVVRISDNGSGIPEEMREKVFSPNFTSKSSGTGLGLAISANIIESINGSIHFETEVDEGTTFFIEIPLMHMEDNFQNPERVLL